ncbi:MAG: peptidase, partial [Helicobacter sp.]|nr:peptidase [Helicobacter sp.]
LMLRDFENLECLFTSDEEIGMIGANNIELKVQSPFMINCDSEDIQEIIFSCAGGYDLQASKSFKSLKIPKDFTIHEIRTKNFIGGHSGIEIHKHIPNAILELAKIAKRLEGIILSFIGGEKRNSIPTHATLKIALPPQSQSFLQSIDSNFFDILRLNNAADFQEGYQCEILIDTLLGLSNGVLKGDTSPILSSNLGILRQKDNAFTLVVMGRGNQEKLMQDNLQSQKKFLEKSGFDTQVLDYYAPWEKEESDLLFKVRDIYQKNNPNTLLKSIHAGLECGILKQKYPNIQFVSIGPTILHPHSLQESLDIQSFKTFWHLLNQILLSYA